MVVENRNLFLRYDATRILTSMQSEQITEKCALDRQVIQLWNSIKDQNDLNLFDQFISVTSYTWTSSYFLYGDITNEEVRIITYLCSVLPEYKRLYLTYSDKGRLFESSTYSVDATMVSDTDLCIGMWDSTYTPSDAREFFISGRTSRMTKKWVDFLSTKGVRTTQYIDCILESAMEGIRSRVNDAVFESVFGTPKENLRLKIVPK